MSKKRKESGQSTTLLKFFNQLQTLGNTTHADKSDSYPTNQAVSHEVLAKRETQSLTKWSQEVIVIDSDDEMVEGTTCPAFVPKRDKESSSTRQENIRGDMDKTLRKRRRSQSPTKRSTSSMRDENIFVEGGSWLPETHSLRIAEKTQMVPEEKHIKSQKKACTVAVGSALETRELVERSAIYSGNDRSIGSMDYTKDEWSAWTNIKDEDIPLPLETVEDEYENFPSMAAEMLDTCPACGATFLDYDRKVRLIFYHTLTILTKAFAGHPGAHNQLLIG